MDPIANIMEQARLCDEIDADNLPVAELAAQAARLSELSRALAEWRRGGGFDPWSGRS